MEEDYIGEFYSQNKAKLMNYVTRVTGNKDLSEDIVQNVFLRIISSGRLINEATLSSLAFTIASNMSFDYLRHKKVKHHYAKTVDKNDVFSIDTQSFYNAHEIMEILEKGIATLTERNQIIYMMNLFEGSGQTEIALKLDMKVKSVADRLFVARRIIREYMEKKYVNMEKLIEYI
jgi:RNA polymerase sigma factor (sigma-70 family)